MSEPFVDRPDLGVQRWRVVTELVGASLVAGTALLLVGGILGAMLTSGNLDGTDRLELLSRSANPTVAAMVLVGLALLVLPKLAQGGPSWSWTGMASILGALAALVIALLSVSAMLLDLTTGERSVGLRISLVIFRLGTFVPAAVAVWLGGVVASTSPATRRSADPIGRPPEPQ